MHTRTNQCNVGKRWDLSVVLKDQTEWENLIFFGNVFNFKSVGAKKEKEERAFTVQLRIDRWNAQ